MKSSGVGRNLGCCLYGAMLVLAALPASAQHHPQRLSDWLLRNDPDATGYLTGLSWRVSGEVPAQLSLKLELLRMLEDKAKTGTDPQARLLGDFVNSLPVTGRVPISVVDARWLQANPARDPVLLPGHTIDLPQRPRTVTVLLGTGVRCLVPHVAGQEAGRYVEACTKPGDGGVDWAWVAQPDGRTARYGIATWNAGTQNLPAPGAWIWAPPRNAHWSESFSEKLVTFLSYQGPASDRVDVAAKPASAVAGSGGAADGVSWSKVVSGLIDPAPQSPPAPQEHAQISPGLMQRERSHGLPVTASDWGTAGLLQTPSARMRDAGDFSLSFSHVEPYTRINLFVQPFKWMEAGFRYTDISNRLYGPASFSGDQSYKDKGVDVKFSLWDESAYVPAIALGFRDIAGTGLFSSEYVVAGKRFGNFDFSLGLGWGNIAGVPRVPASGSTTGEFQFSNYFSGTPQIFGGLQWQTPWESLLLKAEYDGNNYQNEPLGNQFEQKSRINFGLTYRPFKWLDITTGFERGNQFSLGLTMHTDLSRLSTPKLHDAPRIPVSAARPQTAPDWAKTAQDLKLQTDWSVSQIKADHSRVTVTLDDPRGTYWQERSDRAVSVLHRDAPADVNQFVLRYRTDGLDLSEQVVDRGRWVESRMQPVPPSQQKSVALLRDVPPVIDEGKPQFVAKSSDIETDFRIGYRQTLGGPDGFVLYQIYAQETLRMRLGRPDTWLTGALNLRLLDNYDKFKQSGTSNLPRVRTYLREYLTTSLVTMPTLQVTHARKVADNQYASVYGGYLEEMFAGVGGEWLYRPFASRLAYGIDINAVQQRDFHQNFAMLDPAYRTVTGHATMYWDTGWEGVETRVSAGRYLAKDAGITVEVSKQFNNGVVFGAFATKTNVSAQEFGEGSFDKGIFISIPFDAMLTRSTGNVGYFEWKPLTRDGGAKLWRRERLYDITRSRDLRTFEFKPAPQPDNVLPPEDHQPDWKPERQAPAAFTAVVPKVVTPNSVVAATDAGQRAADGGFALRLTEALDRQGFRNVAVNLDTAYRLNLKVAHDHLQPISRAVGRAARTALNLAPADVREIRIQFAQRVEPLVEYDFFDLKRLRLHLSGELPVTALKDVVAVRYINPGAREADPLSELADTSRVAQIPALNDVKTLAYYPSRVLSDFGNAAEQAGKADWLRFAGIGLAAVAGASVLDNKGLSFAKEHANSSWLKALNNVGDAVPWVGFVGAGLLALDGTDPRRSRTGYAAVEAGLSAVVVSTGLKYAVGRPRPNSGTSKWDLQPFSGDPYNSMPSNHTAMAWAVATPFALEYRAPWLYGIAALTNLSRVGKQSHWFSDTVAGSVLGYGLGRLFWESARGNSAMPQVFVDPSSINFSWDFY